MDKDATFDVRGHLCPLPNVHLAKKVKDMRSGQVLELLSDDRGSKADVPAWCESTGHQLLAAEDDGSVFRFYIKVK